MGVKSSCRLVISGVFQGLILGHILFNIFMVIWTGGPDVECKFCMFGENIKLGGSIDLPEEGPTERYGQLGQRTGANCISINKTKCQTLCFGHNNPMLQMWGRVAEKLSTGEGSGGVS